MKSTRLATLAATGCVFALLAMKAAVFAEIADEKAGALSVFGADLSLLQHLQDHGVEYKEAGHARDPLLIFKDHGFNYVRLRLFVAPDGTEGQVNTLDYTLRLASRAKQAGFKLLLDFHYSDGWADPSHQIVPAAWKTLSHALLVERVFNYTSETLDAFRHAGCPPDMVQVGNEITNGMIWPDGGPLKAETNWDALTDLIKAGIRGVRRGDPEGAIKIMIHVDRGGNKDVSRWFFEHLQKHGVEFDVIGLSYYPFWHGTMAELAANLAALSTTCGKDIIVAETGYNMARGDPKKSTFECTPEGQKAFLEALLRTVAATPGGHGKGIFYWAPEWIMGTRWNAPKWSAQWEDRALFDRAGNMLPAMRAVEDFRRNGSRPETPP